MFFQVDFIGEADFPGGVAGSVFDLRVFPSLQLKMRVQSQKVLRSTYC